MSEIYFEICPFEDGVRIEKIFDINKYLENIIEEDDTEFLNDFPENKIYKNRNIFKSNDFSWDEDIRILIKGKIVTPKKVNVTTKYKMEE